MFNTRFLASIQNYFVCSNLQSFSVSGYLVVRFIYHVIIADIYVVLPKFVNINGYNIHLLYFLTIINANCKKVLIPLLLSLFCYWLQINRLFRAVPTNTTSLFHNFSFCLLFPNSIIAKYRKCINCEQEKATYYNVINFDRHFQWLI